jgi:formate dehydrogenase major subunit
MLRLTINGQPGEINEGATILEALRKYGLEVPMLCHDDRLEPIGGCRLCVVEVKGWSRYATACNTPVLDGMEIETHSDAVESSRRTLLRLLAQNYPLGPAENFPGKPFHRLLRQYGIPPQGNGELTGNGSKPFKDASHPYLHVDMAQCINCYRCVRICDELQGQFVWRPWERGAATQIRPHGGGNLLASPCVSCGGCADACPTGAIEDQSVLLDGPAETWTRTTCPYCGTGCEMHLGTRGGKIVQVKPVLDAPVNKGHLCVKGRYAYEFTHSPERMTKPMIRRGATWEAVSWEEATSFVAARLSGIINEHGPQSVGMVGSARGTNEENYIVQKFARIALRTNNVDCCARVCHAPTAAAMKRTLGTGAATNSFDDIERASCFLIAGCNPTEAHPIVGARIKQAVLRGAKLIVIDPREIELTRYATLHLALKPGTNVALFNSLAHVIVEEGLTDEYAMRERIRDFGEFREFIREWTPERAQAICEVEAEQIREAARLYARTNPAMAFHGLGMTEHLQGTEGVMALVNLALLTGNFGKPGSGVNPLRGQNNVQGSAHMGCEPGHLTGYVPIDQGRDLFEFKWCKPLPIEPGLNLLEMLDAAGNDKLKGFWAVGYDVALTNPATKETEAALANVDLVIVQDLFVNELARKFANVLLPAASPFEKDGTFMNSERRVQRVRSALPPMGESKPDWKIVCDVAHAMGFGDSFAFNSAEEIWNEVREVWPAGRGMTYERLDQGGLQWPCPDESHPGTAILHIDSFPSGKTTQLQCIAFEASMEQATGEFPFLLTTGRSLFQYNAGTMTMRTLNRELRRTDTLDLSPADAESLGLHEGDRARIVSRHGSAELPVRVDTRVKSLEGVCHLPRQGNRPESSHRERPG